MSVIVHRDLPGEHNTEAREFWCSPVVIEDDDFRSTEEILEAAKVGKA